MAVSAVHKPMAWHKARQQFIGGSDIGAVLGLSPYKSALDVYNEKVADEPIITELNPAMEFGLRLEPVIAEKYSEVTGLKVQNRNAPYIHPKYPYMGVNIDRLIVGTSRGPGILEIKTANSWAVRQWEEGLPLSYYAQLQWQMLCSGHKWGDIALLVDGRNYESMPFEFDLEFAAMMEHQAAEFWNNHVIPGIPPEPNTDAEAKKAYPVSASGKMIEAIPEVVKTHWELMQLREEKKALEERETHLAGKLKIYMKDAEILTSDDDVLATWKTTISNRFDQKAFGKDHPELLAEYKKPSSSRRFLPKEV